MILIKNPIAIILIALFFSITTCTTDNTITGNSDQTLGKTTGVVEINSPYCDDDEDKTPWDEAIDKIWNRLSDESKEFAANLHCLFKLTDFWSVQPLNTSTPYDFRDNYLSKSYKGEVYTACYYLLSKYGIENDLVNKYHKEHYDLLKSGIEIAYDLQYGSNNNRILIDKLISDDLKNMLKVYRNSPKYKEIEPVLDYLEMDLVKYENQPKSKIALDFESN